MNDKIFITDDIKKRFNEEVVDIRRMGGLTNISYHVTTNKNEYAYRLPGRGTEELINRHDEKISTLLASELGIDTEIYYFDDESGVKISKYLTNSITMDSQSLALKENVILVAGTLRKLHRCGQDTKVVFDFMKFASDYEKIILKHNVDLFEDYEEIKVKIKMINNKLHHNVLFVASHNDPLCENWIRKDENMYLVDWEYAGMNDEYWDLADVSIEAEYSELNDQCLLKNYFGRELATKDIIQFTANKLYIDYLWALWGKTRVPYDGKNMNDYANYRFERLKENLLKMEHLIR